MSDAASQHLKHLRRSFVLARRAGEKGNRPFGAVLVDQNDETLLEAENNAVTDHDITGHAEINLVREACRRFPPEQMRGCTIYASAEPCPMCSGAMFWSGVARIVFALSSERIYAMDPDNENQLPLSCRDVLRHGRRHVEVVGPLFEEEALGVFG